MSYTNSRSEFKKEGLLTGNSFNSGVFVSVKKSIYFLEGLMLPRYGLDYAEGGSIEGRDQHTRLSQTQALN